MKSADRTRVAELGKRLGYQFHDARLAATALRHRSAGAANNERLEFIGDALLGAYVARVLYAQFPDANEGRLTRLRASVVRKESLAAVARQLGLGELLILGPGELKSGGHRRDSILADAVEAIIGSVYLDGGHAACEALMQRLFGEQIASLDAKGELKDPKTRLQEYLQARGLPLPEYTCESAPAQPSPFRVVCRVAGLETPLPGSGESIRRAEQAAAAAVLRQLQVLSGD